MSQLYKCNSRVSRDDAVQKKTHGRIQHLRKLEDIAEVY